MLSKQTSPHTDLRPGPHPIKTDFVAFWYCLTL